MGGYVMQKSYNGWDASPNPREIGIVPFVVHGVSFPGGVKGGDVETVLRYAAEQWHKRVEALVPGWCWGYNFRKNRNANNLSVHASGGAIDINAPRHPNGKRGTVSPAQAREIRAICAEVDNVIRWGESFADEMHLEICKSPAEVARVAKRIRSGDAPAPSTTTSKPKLPVKDDEDMLIIVNRDSQGWTAALVIPAGVVIGIDSEEYQQMVSQGVRTLRCRNDVYNAIVRGGND